MLNIATNVLSMFEISDTSSGIPVDVLERILVKDWVNDALRGIGYWLIKGTVKIGDYIYSAISEVLSVNILSTFFETHFDEIKEISKSLLFLTIIVYAIMMLFNSDLIKGMVKQLFIFSILISSMTYIVTSINDYYTTLGNYATSEISVSDSIFKDIVSENIYVMDESVNQNRLVSLKEISNNYGVAIDSTHLNISNASEDEPLNFKVAFILEDGTYMTTSLEKSYWSLGKLNEKVYTYSFDFTNIEITCICVAVMIFFMLFKIANLMVYGIILPVVSPLVSSTDLSGVRTKKLAQTIIVNFASLFLLLFLFEMYLTMLSSLLIVSNIIARAVYLVALGGAVLGSERLIATITGVAPQQEGKLSTMLTALLIRDGMRMPSKLLGNAFNNTKDFFTSSKSGNSNGEQQGNTFNPISPNGGNPSGSIDPLSSEKNEDINNTINPINSEQNSNLDNSFSSLNDEQKSDITDTINPLNNEQSNSSNNSIILLSGESSDNTNIENGSKSNYYKNSDLDNSGNRNVNTFNESKKTESDSMKNSNVNNTTNSISNKNKYNSSDTIDIESLVNESNNLFGNNKGGKNNE